MSLTAKVNRIDLPRPVSALSWKGHELFDMAGGESTIHISDGRLERKYSGYGQRFDRASACPAGCHQAIYECLGTKALLRRSSGDLEELDRSFYHADVYEFPLALFHRDGRALLAHCPDSYRQLHVDDADAGDRLTKNGRLEARDFFHSRLEASPDGRYLLSAGWFWHPWEALMLFDVDEAIADPRTLDGPGLGGTTPWLMIAAEVAAATFSDSDRVLVATKGGERLDDPDVEEASLGCGELGCWAISEREWVSRSSPGIPLGTLMAVGPAHVLSLYEHPRLIEIASGSIVEEWPAIASGTQQGSLILGDEQAMIPPIARDPLHNRIAIADSTGINVIEFRQYPDES
jgi:hypothetical protein